jgi:hypothetical protein
MLSSEKSEHDLSFLKGWLHTATPIQGGYYGKSRRGEVYYRGETAHLHQALEMNIIVIN